MNKKYLEQFKGIKRWYNVFQAIYLDTKKQYQNTRYQDVIYAFFQNCFHLRDWLTNSEAITKKDKNLDKFLKKNTMRICRDLCNSSKHLILNEPVSIDKNIKLKNLRIPKSMSKKYSHNSDIYYIKAAGGVYSAFDIATECLVDWENFLKENKLL